MFTLPTGRPVLDWIQRTEGFHSINTLAIYSKLFWLTDSHRSRLFCFIRTIEFKGKIETKKPADPSPCNNETWLAIWKVFPVKKGQLEMIGIQFSKVNEIKCSVQGKWPWTLLCKRRCNWLPITLVLLPAMVWMKTPSQWMGSITTDETKLDC